MWIGILTLIVWIYPVAYRTTRLSMILGVALGLRLRAAGIRRRRRPRR